MASLEKTIFKNMISCNLTKKALSLSTISGLGLFCLPVFAQNVSPEELMRILNQQRQQILEQQKRLSELERSLAETLKLQREDSARLADTIKVQKEESSRLEVIKGQQRERVETLKMVRPGSMSFVPFPNTAFTVFGGADMGIFLQSKNGGPNLTYAPDNDYYIGFMGGAEYTPNLGFRVLHKLAPEWTAGFEASGGVRYSGTDTVDYDPFNKAFNIQLGTPYGKLIIGEQLDPAWLATVRSDPRKAKQTYSALGAAWSFGQGSDSPQTSFGPTNAFGYTNSFGNLDVGVLYKPSTNDNANSNVPFNDNHSVGQQYSIGLTYDNDVWRFSGAYIEKYGSTPEINDRDVRGWTLGVGRYMGEWLVQAGVSEIDLPYGIEGPPLGTASPGWPNIHEKQRIRANYIGANWRWNSKNTMDINYSYAYDTLNKENSTQMYVLGNDYSFNDYLSFFISGAVIVTGEEANPLTASTTPDNVAKPNATTLSATSGLRFRF